MEDVLFPIVGEGDVFEFDGIADRSDIHTVGFRVVMGKRLGEFVDQGAGCLLPGEETGKFGNRLDQEIHEVDEHHQRSGRQAASALDEKGTHEENTELGESSGGHAEGAGHDRDLAKAAFGVLELPVFGCVDLQNLIFCTETLNDRETAEAVG